MRYAITLLYDGTNYSGWQIQPNGKSIQKTLQDALNILLKIPVKIIGSGRTDAGVHALNQVAHFDTEEELNLNRVLSSLNGILPLDIRIKNLEKVPENFHAQYHALEKVYEYHITTGPYSSPFTQKYSLYVSYSIDADLLQEAIQLLKGKKDFKSFANDPLKGAAGKNSIRTLKDIQMVQTENGWIFRFIADGFLYKMVRNLMGTLLYLTKRKIQLIDLQKILEAKDRRAAPPPAPAKGLFLSSIQYKQISK